MIKNKAKPIVLLIAILYWTSLIQAQESVNASGGDATGSGGTVAYSVGQIDYVTNTSASGNENQGVQQPYEFFIVGTNDLLLDISITIYPNPTANNLTLEVSDYNTKNLSYKLYDMQGKLLNHELIVASQTKVNMQGFPPATYFVHLINPENKKVQSFKIIKN